MFLRDSDLSNLRDVSDNLIYKYDTNYKYSNYQMNHIKILTGSLQFSVQRHIEEYLKIFVEPILMTNIGDVLFYYPSTKSFYLYYSRLNEVDLIFSLNEVGFNWFIDSFLEDEEIQNKVFNDELFDKKLEEDEILYCPPFLKEESINYKPMKIEMAFDIFTGL